MISLRTVTDLHEQGHALALFCPACDRWSIADLEGLIGAGRGSLAVTDVRFRCRDCGELAEKQVRPPVPTVSGAVAYISAPRT